MTSPRLGRAIPSGTRHALPDTGTTALCGASVTAQAGPFPGTGGGLCRDCARATTPSTGVPFRAGGGMKRPGGM